MGRGRTKVSTTIPLKEYHKSRRVTGYVNEELKDIVLEDVRQHELKCSDILSKAISEYYELRPELVKILESRMGKNYF